MITTRKNSGVVRKKETFSTTKIILPKITKTFPSCYTHKEKSRTLKTTNIYATNFIFPISTPLIIKI
jgi:hypothetical protein